MQYHEQLKHPLWQKKRLEVMEANGFMCEKCESKDEQLNVHHPFYKRGAMIWQYEVEELMCLCCTCHKEEHAKDEQVKKLLALSDRGHIREIIIGLLKCNVGGPEHRYAENHEQAVGIFLHDLACSPDIKLFDKEISVIEDDSILAGR